MQEYTLSIYRGDTYRRDFPVWADTAKTQPADLTGVVVAAEVRPMSGGTPVVDLPLTVTGSVIHLDIPPSLSQTLPASALWDLQLTYSSGDVRTILGGGVRVRADITQSVKVA